MARDWPPLHSKPGVFNLTRGPQHSIAAGGGGSPGVAPAPAPEGISLVGSPVENVSLNGGDITLTLPVGMAQNDVVYVFFGLASAAGGGTTSPDWTQVGADVDNTIRTQVWRKVMGASPDANIVLTGTANLADCAVAVGFALRGVDTTTPEDAAATSATGSSTNPDSPAIVTVTDAAWVLSFFATGVRDTAVTAPVGYTNQVDGSSDDVADCTGGGATKEIAAAGSEDPAAWTGVNTGPWVAWSVAARPLV